jgi:KUP system potassium uptake protein
VVAGATFVVMDTWRMGRRVHLDVMRDNALALDLFLERADKFSQRIAGTAVFLSPRLDVAPNVLLHSLKHYKVLHEQNVILTLTTDELPRVAPEERVIVEGLSKTFTRLRLRYGFMETPDVPKALSAARKLGWEFDIMKTSFFLSRRTLKPAPHSGMPRWQDRLFIALARTANDATAYFQIPSGRVVEIGTQVTV